MPAVGRASEDPLPLEQFGGLEVRVLAAEALLGARRRRARRRPRRAGRRCLGIAASIAVAAAKAATTEAALDASTGLFELSGAQASREQHGLDRLWRDARTHTLHDPVRWKYFAVGNFFLNGTAPPMRPYI